MERIEAERNELRELYENTLFERDEATQRLVSAIEWVSADDIGEIDRDARYLVITNGAAWNDPDLHLWPGFLIPEHLEPQIVRGRVLWAAKIKRPDRDPT
jgi:hypothetical protein